MRALTLTWTSIILVLVILATFSFHTQAQSRERTITRAQIDQVLEKFIPPGYGQIVTREQRLRRLEDCTVRGDCEGASRSLVIKELLLRLQTRDMGEVCTSDGNYSTALYGSPYRDRNRGPDDTHESLRPRNTLAYEAWQDELIETGLIFCSPVKHLSCSSISKKCECRPGTVWNPDPNEPICSVIYGGTCWPPGVARPSEGFVALYDPLSFGFFSYNRIVVLSCQSEVRQSFYGQCIHGLQAFLNNVCTNEDIRDFDEDVERQLKSLPRLNFGDSCNSEHHTQLFTTTEAELKDYKIRVKNLLAILGTQTPFCDLKLLLMCGSGGKCECIKPSTYDPNTKSCTFRNPHETCQEGRSPFGSLSLSRVGKEVMEGIQTARQRDCPLGCADAKFPDGRLVEPAFSFCRTCQAVQGSRGLILVVGKNCDKSLTLFLEGAPPPSLPVDIPEYEKQLELFLQFNEKAKEFEKLFRLDKNTKCDYEGELEVYRSIRRIKDVELPDKVFTEQNYTDLMSSMDKIMGQFGGKGLCRLRLRGEPVPIGNRPLLLCGPTRANSICYETNNTVYLDVLLKRLSGPSSQVSPGGTCAPHPTDIIKYAEKEFGSIRGTKELVPNAYEYLFNTLEILWLQKAQFCNKTGGFICTESVDDKIDGIGKCELLKVNETELEKEKAGKSKLGNNSTSTSSHHSIQPLFQFFSSLYILLSSIKLKL